MPAAQLTPRECLGSSLRKARAHCTFKDFVLAIGQDDMLLRMLGELDNEESW